MDRRGAGVRIRNGAVDHRRHEPAGEAHTLVITPDSPEPALIMFVVEAGLIYLDKPVDGGVAAYEDGFTLLELTRKYYREAGLDVHELDLLVR